MRHATTTLVQRPPENTYLLKLPKFHLLRQLQAWEMGIDGKSLKPLTVVEHNSSPRFPYYPLFLPFTIAPSRF